MLSVEDSSLFQVLMAFGCRSKIRNRAIPQPVQEQWKSVDITAGQPKNMGVAFDHKASTMLSQAAHRISRCTEKVSVVPLREIVLAERNNLCRFRWLQVVRGVKFAAAAKLLYSMQSNRLTLVLFQSVKERASTGNQPFYEYDSIAQDNEPEGGLRSVQIVPAVPCWTLKCIVQGIVSIASAFQAYHRKAQYSYGTGPHEAGCLISFGHSCPRVAVKRLNFVLHSDRVFLGHARE